jgi:hypothetical protein
VSVVKPETLPSDEGEQRTEPVTRRPLTDAVAVVRAKRTGAFVARPEQARAGQALGRSHLGEGLIP